MNHIEERVDQAIRRAKGWWLVHAIVAGTLLWMTLSGWWLLLIPVYLSITYQVVIYATAASLLRSMPPELHELMKADTRSDAMRAFEDIKRQLDQGEIEHGPDLYELIARAGLSIGVIEAASETIIGRLGEVDIHEWIELYDPVTGKAERFFYEEVATKGTDGTYVLPFYENKLTAIIGGLVYARPIQPAQGE